MLSETESYSPPTYQSVQVPCSYCLPGLVLSKDQVHWYYTHAAAPGTQVRGADNLL